MNSFIVRWLINGIALILTAELIEGIWLSEFSTALLAALVLGFTNAVIRPIVLILTFPINILTLGLFTLVVNGMMLVLVSTVVPGFGVSSFLFGALPGALVLSIFSSVLSFFVKFQ